MILDRCSSGFISVGFGTSIVAKKMYRDSESEKKDKFNVENQGK